jgi:hypothetical protein
LQLRLAAVLLVLVQMQFLLMVVIQFFQILLIQLLLLAAVEVDQHLRPQVVLEALVEAVMIVVLPVLELPVKEIMEAEVLVLHHNIMAVVAAVLVLPV